jgi:hypothetical protein
VKLASRVVGAEEPFTVFQGLFMQKYCHIWQPCRLQRIGEAVAGGQGVGVVGAEEPFTVFQRACMQPDG